MKSEGFNFEGQSYLFWEFIAIREHYKPKYFLLENVMFSKKWRDVFNKTIGFESDVINSALLSAQNRKRQYWLGKLNDSGGYDKVSIYQPEDKGTLLKDIIETNASDIYDSGKITGNDNNLSMLNSNYKSQANSIHNHNGKSPTICADTHGYANGHIEKIKCGAIRGRYLVNGKRQDHKQKTAGLTEQRLELRKDEKTNTLTTVQKDNVIVNLENTSYTDRCKVQIKKNSKTKDQKGVALCGNSNITGSGVNVLFDDKELTYRKLTPRECLRLQTLPEHIIDKMLDCGVSNTQIYKMCGNGFTCEVIAHILRHIK